MSQSPAKPPPASRKTLIIVGSLLIFISALVTGVWYCWLLPLAERFDSAWEAKFSRKQLWKERQKQILRFGWVHDDFSSVGYCGDEWWVDWIMKRAEAGGNIGGCENGHQDEALSLMTCHQPASSGGGAVAGWLAWWRTNRHKSQREWIQDGLKAAGVAVHFPPQESDYEPLLTLIGNGNQDDGKVVSYNAFRWLRDSGFEAVSFAMTKVTAETPAAIRQGLLKYAKREKSLPRDEGLGLLDLGQPPPAEFGLDNHPFFSRPSTKAAGYILMFLPLLCGAVMLALACRPVRMDSKTPDGAA